MAWQLPPPPPPKLSLLVRGLPKLPLTPEEVFLYIHRNCTAPVASATTLSIGRLPGGSMTGELTFDQNSEATEFKERAPTKWPAFWGKQTEDIEYIAVDREKAFWPP